MEAIETWRAYVKEQRGIAEMEGIKGVQGIETWRAHAQEWRGIAETKGIEAIHE